MLAQGTYRARAIEGVWGESKTKGTPFVRVSFKVTDDGENAGSVVSWDGYFTPNTEKRSVESLRHCGCTFPGNNVTDLAGLGSTEVSIVVEHETFDAKDEDGNTRQKTRARVQWVNAPGGIPEDQRMDDRQKSTFAAKMKGLLVASRPATSAAPSPKREAPRSNGYEPEPSYPIPDEDPPF